MRSIIDCKNFTSAKAGCRQWSSLVGKLWLRWLLGISVAPQVGGIFNESVRDHAAKRWNGVSARRTTQSGATHHRRYQATRKSLDAAECTGEPLLVIA